MIIDDLINEWKFRFEINYIHKLVVWIWIFVQQIGRARVHPDR